MSTPPVTRFLSIALGTALAVASIAAGIVFVLTPVEEPPAPGTERVVCTVVADAPTVSGLIGPPVVYGHLSVQPVRVDGRTHFDDMLYAEPIGSPIVRVDRADGGTLDLDLSHFPLETWHLRGFVYHHEQWDSLEGTALSAKAAGWEGTRRSYFHVAVGGIRPGQALVVDVGPAGVTRIVPVGWP